MEELRASGEAPVRDVMEALNSRTSKKRAYTTYMTIMARLHKKGALMRRREGKSDFYAPIHDLQRYMTLRAWSEVEGLVLEYGDVALSHFAQQMADLDPARRQRIGDVVAGTMVVAVDGQSGRGTPGWLLPTATIFAVLVSAASAFAVFSARPQPLTDAQRTEFIAGCESTPSSQFAGCGCVLNELQAAGYDTLSTLRGVFIDARSEALNGASGTARTTVSNAVATCRR